MFWLYALCSEKNNLFLPPLPGISANSNENDRYYNFQAFANSSENFRNFRKNISGKFTTLLYTTHRLLKIRTDGSQSRVRELGSKSGPFITKFWIQVVSYNMNKFWSTITSNLGWVSSPSPRTVGAIGTPKSKSGKLLIYPPSSGPRPAGARQYYTTSGVPGWTHKISIDIRPMLSPFLHGGQNIPNFNPNFDSNRLWTAVFLKGGILSEIRNTLGKDRW